MTVYSWQKDPTNCGAWHRLLPLHSVIKGPAIATIYPVHRDNTTRRFRASYTYQSTSGGNKRESWALFGTVHCAKTWVRRQLAKFHEPPQIEG